jgi:hypothetical protein
MIGGMPVDSHLLALFFVTSVVAMMIPGPETLFIGLGVRLAAER